MLLGSLLAAIQQVAVLESGARVECSSAPAIGARSIATAWGAWEATRDPVVAVHDAAEDRAALEPLRELEFTAWCRRAAERGLIGALLAADPQGADRAPWMEELARLGAHLDPLPNDAPRDERVELLWKRLHKAKGRQRALLCGRLESEISEGSSAPSDRRLGLVDLRRALRDRDPDLRWVGARLALKQRESSMTHVLLEASLEDDDAAARTAAAASLKGMEPEYALGWWVLGMWRERGTEQRVRAIENLTAHGRENPHVVKALVMGLSAAGHQEPGSYAFFGRQITVVMDFDVEVALAAVIADPVVSVITEGAVLHVRVFGATVAGAMRAALQDLTGADPGPSARDWRAWMRENLPEVARED